MYIHIVLVDGLLTGSDSGKNRYYPTHVCHLKTCCDLENSVKTVKRKVP